MSSKRPSVSRVASRFLVATEPREIASLYLHLSNGGATYKVIDAGKGPEFIASISSFGEMDSQIRIETSADNLRRIGEMLLYAAEHGGYSKHWDSSSPGLSVLNEDKALSALGQDQMIKSLERSLEWWEDRDERFVDQAMERVKGNKGV